MTVEETLDALYAGAVEGFTAARDAAAKALKAAGDAEGAKTVKAQHKPTQAAHALNRLVRDERARLDELFELGLALSAAQQGRGGDLHALIERQRGMIQVLASKLPAADAHAIIGVLQGALVDAALAAQLKLARFSKLPEAPIGFFGAAPAGPVVLPVRAVAPPAPEKHQKPTEDDGAARRDAEARAAAEAAERKARRDDELRKAKTDAAVAQADADAKAAQAKNLEFTAREARKVADAAAAHAAKLVAVVKKLEEPPANH